MELLSIVTTVVKYLIKIIRVITIHDFFFQNHNQNLPWFPEALGSLRRLRHSRLSQIL